MSNENLTSKFIYPYGAKISGSNAFNPDMDTTDQRSPVNDIQELYNQFIIDHEIMDELDSESIDDFDEDFYEYDDRSEFGVDVAAALTIPADKLPKRQKKEKKDK